MSIPEPLGEKLLRVRTLADMLESAKDARPQAIAEAAYIGLVIGLSQTERNKLANMSDFIPPIDVPLGPPADTGFNKLSPPLQAQLIKDFSHA